jgi:hypothetical protein
MKSHASIMPQPLRARALLLFGLATVMAAPLRADLNSDLAFSAFSNVDVNAMAGGTVLQARGALLSFPRGITTQSLYIIDASPAAVQSKLIHWSPARHSELKVWMHLSLMNTAMPANSVPMSRSGSMPAITAADFPGLGSLPDNSSVQFQIASTAKLTPDNPILQLSKEEAQTVETMAAQQKDPKTLFVSAWSQILSARINDFLSSRAGSDYDLAGGGNIRPLSDVKSLLHADIKVYGQYQRLLNQTPAKALAGGSAPKLMPADLYYECFDVEGYAAVGTGAVYQAVYGPSIQSADIEYYVNSGIYAEIELEQLWPINVNGKTETLVWRDDLVSAPNLAYLHGTERLASGMIMLQETKQGIEAFRAEFR